MGIYHSRQPLNVEYARLRGLTPLLRRSLQRFDAILDLATEYREGQIELPS